MGFMRWCNVVVVLNAMPIFVFLNKLVIFLIFGLWKVSVVQIFFVILASFLLLTLCNICRLSFSNSWCGKLLFLAIYCIICHFVSFLSGSRGKECIIVTWNLKNAIFLLYGMIRMKVNCCVCSGWFPVYVHFKFSIIACYTVTCKHTKEQA